MSFERVDVGDLSVLELRSREEYTLADATPANLDDNATAYDAAGRLTSYRYTAQAADESWYTHTFSSVYEGWEGYQEKTVAGTSSNNAYKPTTNTLTYDDYGRLLKQQEHTEYQDDLIDDRVRVYANTAEGQVQTRREGTRKKVNGVYQFVENEADTLGQKTNYGFVYSGGQQVAELKSGGKTRSGQALGSIVGVNGAGAYAAGGGTVTVLAGETLRDLAQRVYGTNTLWYVLADANGLSDAETALTAGHQLKAPGVNVNRNDAGTFRPYDPNEAIGGTAPGLPYIAPAESGCDPLVIMIQAIVTVLVSYYAGPVAGAAAGDAAGQASAAMMSGQYDWGAFFKGITNPKNVALAHLALSSPTLSSAALFSGKDEYRSLVNPIDYGMDYDYGRTATAVATAYVTGGWSGQGGVGAWAGGGIRGGMVSAAAAYATNLAVNKALDRPASFSWRGMLGAVASAGVSEYVFGDGRWTTTGPDGSSIQSTASPETPQPFNWKEVAQHAMINIAKRALDYGVRKLFKAPDTHWNTANVLAGSFGDTLGSMMTGQIRPQVGAVKQRFSELFGSREAGGSSLSDLIGRDRWGRRIASGDSEQQQMYRRFGADHYQYSPDEAKQQVAMLQQNLNVLAAQGIVPSYGAGSGNAPVGVGGGYYVPYHVQVDPTQNEDWLSQYQRLQANTMAYGIFLAEQGIRPPEEFPGMDVSPYDLIDYNKDVLIPWIYAPRKNLSAGHELALQVVGGAAGYLQSGYQGVAGGMSLTTQFMGAWMYSTGVSSLLGLEDNHREYEANIRHVVNSGWDFLTSDGRFNKVVGHFEKRFDEADRIYVRGDAMSTFHASRMRGAAASDIVWAATGVGGTAKGAIGLVGRSARSVSGTYRSIPGELDLNYFGAPQRELVRGSELANMAGASGRRANGLIDLSGAERTIFSGPVAPQTRMQVNNWGAYQVDSVRYMSQSSGATWSVGRWGQAERVVANGGLPKGITYEGSVYRAVDPSYADGAWRINSYNIADNHRYSGPGRGALYASTSPEGVLGELRHYGIDPSTRVMLDREVRVDNVLDLTDPAVRRQLGVDLNDLIRSSQSPLELRRSSGTPANDYFMTHALGDFSRARYNGLLVPSARESGTSHLVFFDHADP